MQRLKERDFPNSAAIKHDVIGNYIDFNGIRLYQRDVAMADGDSTTVSGVKAPRGSWCKTKNPVGADYIFIAGDSTWQAIGRSDDVDAVPASGYMAYTVPPVDGDTFVANGVTFTWKNSPVGAVQAAVAVGADLRTPSDTILGVSLENMVAKLNASANGSVSGATYSTNATGGFKNGTRILVNYDTAGTAGNSYTLAGSVGTRSAATLTGGSAAIGGVAAHLTHLTAASGVTGNTVTDVGVAFDQATLNNNFKVIADKVNAMLSAFEAVNQMASS